MFWAGGCASCHAGEDAEGEDLRILSGGQRLASEFGTFVAPNISPDPEHGIGDWTLAEFRDRHAERHLARGTALLPSAFPYTAYRMATRQDMADLFRLPQHPARLRHPRPEPHQVSFPVTITRGIGALEPPASP